MIGQIVIFEGEEGTEGGGRVEKKREEEEGRDEKRAEQEGNREEEEEGRDEKRAERSRERIANSGSTSDDNGRVDCSMAAR